MAKACATTRAGQENRPPGFLRNRRSLLVAMPVPVGMMRVPASQPPLTDMGKNSSRLLLAAGLAFLAACSGGSQVNPSIISAATSRGVAPSTTSKMSNAQSLAFGDILNLVSKGVPDATIEAYLASTRQVCRFSTEQISKLRSAGASQALLSYLGDTSGFYDPRQPAPGAIARKAASGPAGQYMNTRGYQNQQPFAYNEPAIDGFYDSGYEESLYSPFSFN